VKSYKKHIKAYISNILLGIMPSFNVIVLTDHLVSRYLHKHGSQQVQCANEKCRRDLNPGERVAAHTIKGHTRYYCLECFEGLWNGS